MCVFFYHWKTFSFQKKFIELVSFLYWSTRALENATQLSVLNNNVTIIENNLERIH